MSFTQWFTRSAPTVWCRFMAKAIFSLVPTPSALDTKTGSRYFVPRANNPPKLPMSLRTLRVNVFCARYLMRCLARSARLISTPASEYVTRRGFFWAEDWAKQSGPSGGMAGRKSVSPEAEQQSGAPPPNLRHVADSRGVETDLVQQIRIEPCRTRRVIRPEDEDGFSDHIGHRHGPPVPAVFRVVAIVAKHKERIRGYAPRRNVFLP